MNEIRFDSNNYEFNKSSKIGVYILHGFSSTTYEVKQLAQFLSEHGYHTVANNLPGHGTNLEECNRIKFNHWLDFVKKDVAKLSSESEKIFVIGNSMGAVLTLFLASLFPLNGFVAAGTVLKFKKYFSTNILVPIFCRMKKYQQKNKVVTVDGVKFYGYDKYPLIALNEYRKMINKIVPLMPKIKSPGLIIHSWADNVSTEENVKMINNYINNQNLETMYVDNAHHNMFDNNKDQKKIFKKILDFLNKYQLNKED